MEKEKGWGKKKNITARRREILFFFHLVKTE